ncbi:MAG: hypothetical protein EOM26_11995 [Alphaproteobacteria bacterium]|nr:hypothetical protein [Alphaproteobacteria bacterium]
MFIPALKASFAMLKARRRLVLHLALPLTGIYASLMGLHVMFSQTLGIVYRTAAGFFGIEFLFLPFVLGFFSVALLKALVGSHPATKILHPLRLRGFDQRAFGSALFLYFAILNLPFFVIGLWGWLGPDHLQGWLGARGILFFSASAIAAFLTAEQILQFPALADGRSWSLGQTAQATEGLKLDLCLALVPVGVLAWVLAQAPVWLIAPLIPEGGLPTVAGIVFFLVAVSWNAAMSFCAAALWCGITVWFYNRVKADPRKTPLFDPRNPENIG